jgi:hypothetical protein
MIAGWRAEFAPLSSKKGRRLEPLPWVGVQLPAYGVNATGLARNPVFEMRLGQAAGVLGVGAAEVVPTYDLSCPSCPWGSIHPTHKEAVGSRIASRLSELIAPGERGSHEPRGPRAVKATASRTPRGNSTTIHVEFELGPTPASLQLMPTRNCTTCCQSGSDFDVSSDGGLRWVAGVGPATILNFTLTFDVAIQFELAAMEGTKLLVRYTATRNYPQCAVVDSSSKLPAYPFQMVVAS